MFKQLLKNKIFKNFSILTVANIAVQILSILSSIRLARLLQPEGYGFFNILMVQASTFSIIAVYGLRLVIIRYVARNKFNSKYSFIISNKIRLVTSLIAFLSLIIYNSFLNDKPLTFSYLMLLMVYIMFMTFWDTIESVAYGNERMEASGLLNVLFTVFWVITIYTIPQNIFNVKVLLISFIVLQIFKTLSYYLWLNKVILKKDQSFEIESGINYKYFINESKYFFLLSVFTAFSNQVPILLLNNFSSLEEVGLFNLGNRILSPMQMVLNTALTALYPTLSRLALVNKELYATRVKSLINVLVIIGIWGCFCFTLFSREVVLLLYGEAYLTSSKMIIIQCWYTLLFGIFCTIGTIFNSFDKQKFVAILSVIYSILAFPIFFFSSKYGAIGLAWGFVIGAYVNMTYHWFFLKKLLNPYISLKYTIILFLFIIISSFLSTSLPFEFNFSLKLIFGVCITLIAAYLLRFKELPKLLVKN